MSQNEELHRLRKENRALKKKLYKLEKAAQADSAEEDNTDHYAESNYFSFLLSRLRAKGFYPTVKKAAKYFKSSLWITRIFRIGLLLYQYLQAGAFVLLYTAIFILLIPILLAVSLLTLGMTLLLRNRNAVLLMRQARRDIVFLLVKNKDGFDAEVLQKEAARHPDATVLIVSPFFFRKNGIGKNTKMYVCFRKESENIYILRNYFFFYFRRRLQKKGGYQISEIPLASQK